MAYSFSSVRNWLKLIGLICGDLPTCCAEPRMLTHVERGSDCRGRLWRRLPSSRGDYLRRAPQDNSETKREERI